MSLLRALSVCLVLAVLPLYPAAAADTKPPRIVAAQMVDKDVDDRADRLVLTYSEKISHALDKDGKYPFKVDGYKVTKVGKAANSLKLKLFLKEKAAPDLSATPPVTYTRTRKKPVKDKAGNQAKNQTFAKTASYDLDGDGYAADDCDPQDPAIHPGADDPIDDLGVDSNCDGIDGDIEEISFVSTTGSDSGICGSISSPCLTVQQGIDRAVAEGDDDVFIAAGTYNEAIVLADGIGLRGGFDEMWNRAPNSNVTSITGLDHFDYLGNDLAVAAVADDLTQSTLVADLKLLGPNATGDGRTSYTLAVKGSPANTLTLENVVIDAGNGSDGATGTTGGNATSLSNVGLSGGPGGDGSEPSPTCDSTSKGAPGPAGVNPGATGGSNPAGGAGGAGGTMDTDCNIFSGYDLTARAGSNGSSALVSVPPDYGPGGAGGPANGCMLFGGLAGKPGRVVNGPAGPGAPPGGLLVANWWSSHKGLSGGVGEHGGGGGGGGGTGGCDEGTDSWGPGGGGGGAGGARALSGGGGGFGGGGSFGIFLVESTISFSEGELRGGVAGDGGTGGSGGRGQPGGTGGSGGSGDGTLPGGAGGAGGHGGHGGGGGGGAGGISALVVLATDDSQANLTSVASFPGTPGAAGVGGTSAPTAPGPEDDGNDGQSGASGSAHEILTCATVELC